MRRWVAVKVEFDANDEQCGVLREVSEWVEGSEVRLVITTRSEPDPKLVKWGRAGRHRWPGAQRSRQYRRGESAALTILASSSRASKLRVAPGQLGCTRGTGGPRRPHKKNR
jgi:hypothetical protein